MIILIIVEEVRIIKNIPIAIEQLRIVIVIENHISILIDIVEKIGS
jgi:hypothetical protein